MVTSVTDSEWVDGVEKHSKASPRKHASKLCRSALLAEAILPSKVRCAHDKTAPVFSVPLT